MEKVLVKFRWDCGRMGDVDGLFIADKKELQDTIGKEIYFGEILGKHSEVYGTLEEKDIKIIDVPTDVVEALEKALGKTNISGRNPLDYISESEEE